LSLLTAAGWRLPWRQSGGSHRSEEREGAAGGSSPFAPQKGVFRSPFAERKATNRLASQIRVSRRFTNKEIIVATLVVIGYESEVKAEEVRIALLKLQKEYLIDLADAVVVVRDEKGKVKLRQMYDLTAAGAVSGGFWGALIGLIFLNPLFGMAI